MSAVLLANEGALMAETTGDARRLLLARLAIDHRLRPRNPLSLDNGPFEVVAANLLLSDAPAGLDQVAAALAA